MAEQEHPVEDDSGSSDATTQGQEVNSSTRTNPSNKPSEKKPGILKRIWGSIGLDLGIVLMMAKAGIPPVVSLAAYQSSTWDAKYTTIGYLVAIMSVLGMCIMPRAKFTQTMLLNILFVCVGAAFSLLQMYTTIKARQHTTTTAPSTTPQGASGSSQAREYNGSASTVAAVWLFVTIYGANAFRAARPQLQFPCIIYSIFTIVASTYAPQFATTTQIEGFTKRLLEAFLTGFGICAGVSYLILPVTSRKLFWKQFSGFVRLTQASLKAHQAYVGSLNAEQRTNSASQDPSNGAKGSAGNGANTSAKSSSSNVLSSEAKAMKTIITQMSELFGKMNIEIGFARREVAYGHFRPSDLSTALTHLREILLPVFGMSTFIEIVQAAKEHKRSVEDMIESEETVKAIHELQTEEWDEMMAVSQEQFGRLNEALQDGLTHVLITLGLAKKPKTPTKDVESQTSANGLPGETTFVHTLESRITEFRNHRERTLKTWCEKNGLDLPADFWDDANQITSVKDMAASQADIRQRHNQQMLYLILYIEYLTFSVSKKILAVTIWSDSKVADGTLTKRRVIAPGFRTLKKWAGSLFAADDTDGDHDIDTNFANIYVGDSLNKTRKDPEHLEPVSVYEKVTNSLRVIPRALASPASAFGFRAACATMSIGILAFLEQTQTFFIKQRLLWSLIMIAISMGAHSGQGIFGFICRVVGSIFAMCVAYAVWYMSDEKPAAILPVLYVFVSCGFYFVFKFPKLVIVPIISIVTTVLVIGYELQVQKIGVKAASSNGQPYYPLYELAPYRVATVVGGLLVAFIWTYFPYAITTHSTLRKDLGATLYLLGNYYSCIHTTVEMRLRLGVRDDEDDKSSPNFRLSKARNKVFRKTIVLLNKLREHSSLVKWEPKFGGKFPQQTYNELIESMRNTFSYTTLISYSTKTFVAEASEESESEWLRSFRSFASDLDLTTHEITSMLCLLSSSMVNGQPLPPYIRHVRPYNLRDKVLAREPDLLSLKHVAEPCYAAFAVLQVASSLISEELKKQVRLVRQLVGEVDFSFHVISTSSEEGSSANTSTATLWEKLNSYERNRNGNGNGKRNGSGSRSGKGKDE